MEEKDSCSRPQWFGIKALLFLLFFFLMMLLLLLLYIVC